jgi:hypothetical protein
VNASPKILLSHLFHREQRCFKLDFEYNRDLILFAKKAGCKWSASNNCWYLSNTKENFNLLFYHFKGVAFLDFSLLKSGNHPVPEKISVAPKEPKQLLKVRYAKLSAEKKETIRSYTNFLKGRRYSNSTVSVYGTMIIEFVIFCQNKTVNEINNNNVELFCQQFIAKGNYSISYQRQFIGDKKSIANLQFEMLFENPYKYSSDEIFFSVFAIRKELLDGDMEGERLNFFSKGQPCFRASPLTKRYGWGIHNNEDGKIAIYGAETKEYMKFNADNTIKKVKAMRSKRV